MKGRRMHAIAELIKAKQLLKPDTPIFLIKEELGVCANDGCLRMRRKGKPFCSRCTNKGTEQKLRDTLPVGFEPAPALQPGAMDVGATILTDLPVSPDAVDQTELILSDTSQNCPKCGKPKFGPASTMCSADIGRMQDMFCGCGEVFSVPSGEKHYSRKEIAREAGVGVTTLRTWEQKGKTPPPKRLVHNNQYIYTNEHLTAILNFKNQQTDVELKPLPARKSRSRYDEPDTQQAAPGTFNLSMSKMKKLTKGTASSKKLNRVVANRLGHGGLMCRKKVTK